MKEDEINLTGIVYEDVEWIHGGGGA